MQYLTGTLRSTPVWKWLNARVKTRRQVVALSLASGLIVLVLGAVNVNATIQLEIQNRRIEAVALSSSQARTLEKRLGHLLSPVDLLAILQTKLGYIPEFEVIAQRIVDSYQGLGNLQLAPNGVVTTIYPLEGNEGAIGHDLLNDPNRRIQALQTIEARKLTLAGPFNLIQGGGMGMVARTPVFEVDEAGDEQFWGFVNALIFLDDFIKDGTLPDFYTSGYEYQLAHQDPGTGEWVVFNRSSDVDLENPVVIDVVVPNGIWQLSAAPQDGWGIPVDPVQVALVILLAAIVSRLAYNSLITAGALGLSEERFITVAQNTSDLIHAATPDGQFIFMNDAWHTILGYDTPQNHSLWDVIHPDYIETFREIQEKTIETGTSQRQFETRFLAADGTPVIVEGSLTTQTTLADNTVIVHGFFHDITAIKQILNELAVSLEKERELNELKTRFVTMASHEFRTPLASILASAETLQTYGDRLPEDKRLRRFKNIGEQVEHLATMIENILTASQMSTSTIEMSYSTFDLSALFTEIINGLRLHDTSRPINFISSEASVYINADKRLLRRIITNLLSNAIKYSAEDREIRVRLNSVADQIAFEVHNEGTGIPANDQQYLFTAFFRASNVDTIQGTGLGLLITRQAVEAHGGTITLTSNESEGTSFFVTIPANLPDPADTPS